MKIFPSLKTFILTFACVTLLNGLARADFDAARFVNTFNANNNGYGYLFSHSSVNSEDSLVMKGGSSNIDKSAYNTSASTAGSNFIQSFCIEPQQLVSSIGYGKLNYNAQTGVTKNSEGRVLTVGVAYLYSKFASGQLDIYRYDETTNTGNGSNRGYDASYLKLAIQQLLGYQGSLQWTANQFLIHLLQVNSDKSFWTATYKPNQRYDVIGDYAVFALNSYTNLSIERQDFLYVTKADYGGDVPEPASILLWVLGGLGTTGASWRKRRRKLAA